VKRLIILPNNIGDVIMALPIFESLKRGNPADELHFLVESGYEGGALNNPYIDKIHLMPRSESAKALRDEESFPVEAFSLGAWIETLNALQFDQIINYSQHPLYSALASLVDAAEKIGMSLAGEGIDCVNGFWSRYLFAIPYERTCNGFHAIDVYKRIAEVFGDSTAPKLYPSPLERERAQQFLLAAGWDGTTELVVFQPGAAIRAKMWPKDSWIDLGKKVTAAGKCVVLTGAPSERDLCDAIAQELPKSILAAGKTTFRESAILTAFASTVITGDTAQMHAAAALGTKVVALFGPTSPVETGPYGEKHLIFIDQHCAKQPCFLHECDQPLFCLNAISSDAVFEAMNGGTASFATSLANGYYELTPQNGDLTKLINPTNALYLQGILTRDIAMTLPESLRLELTELEKSISLAHGSLLDFSKGNRAAYQSYADHISSLQDSQGIGAFLAAMINVGLNSIPLTDMTAGVAAMLELLEGYAHRLREVLNG